MAQNGNLKKLIGVQYDQEADTLTFSFSPTPRPAVAEEASDDIWVRYDLESNQVVTVDVLNFSTRVHDAFGPQMTYIQRADPERLAALDGFQSLRLGNIPGPISHMPQ